MKLCIPEKILNQHLVVLGKTGAGKSSKLRHIVEHLLNRRKRVCIIDPKERGAIKLTNAAKL